MMMVPPNTIGNTMRAKITATAASFDRMPACNEFHLRFGLSWLSCNTLSDESAERIRSVASLRDVSLARRFDVEAVIPSLSCSRRSLRAFTRLVIGLRTVVAYKSQRHGQCPPRPP